METEKKLSITLTMERNEVKDFDEAFLQSYGKIPRSVAIKLILSSWKKQIEIEKEEGKKNG